MKKSALAVALSLFITGAFLLSIDAKPKRPEGPPPPIKACENKQAGDSCSFKTRGGKTVTDTCVEVKTPRGTALSCGKISPPKRRKGKRPEKEGEEEE
ncbi:MAG TPA: hypothetical protein PK358_08545 [Spirochaetota bacterium]|nr:hypothetical protein [Spirochaetota bacterium]HPJ34868.1 hypothetical protein [Spirochaetota bacterium]